MLKGKPFVNAGMRHRQVPGKTFFPRIVKNQLADGYISVII